MWQICRTFWSRLSASIAKAGQLSSQPTNPLISKVSSQTPRSLSCSAESCWPKGNNPSESLNIKLTGVLFSNPFIRMIHFRTGYAAVDFFGGANYFVSSCVIFNVKQTSKQSIHQASKETNKYGNNEGHESERQLNSFWTEQFLFTKSSFEPHSENNLHLMNMQKYKWKDGMKRKHGYDVNEKEILGGRNKYKQIKSNLKDQHAFVTSIIHISVKML